MILCGVYNNYVNFGGSLVLLRWWCLYFQIGDFGLARDLGGEDVYLSRGGKIPIKWTAPEVSSIDSLHVHTK